MVVVFINVPKDLLLKFFSDDCKQITSEELEQLKKHMIQFCNNTIMYWNPDMRKLVESISSITTPEELKELNMKLVKKGIDCF